jgi:hypothetical protein
MPTLSLWTNCIHSRDAEVQTSGFASERIRVAIRRWFRTFSPHRSAYRFGFRLRSSQCLNPNTFLICSLYSPARQRSKSSMNWGTKRSKLSIPSSTSISFPIERHVRSTRFADAYAPAACPL